MPHRWEDVRITVVRPGPVDQRGACANSIPQDDLKAFTLPSGTVITSSNNMHVSLLLPLGYVFYLCLSVCLSTGLLKSVVTLP